MANPTSARTGRDFLGIYLNDHLAGATAGLEMARRMVAATETGSELWTTLRRINAEIASDRRVLLAIMTELGVPVRGYKVFAGWAAEKAGRLKLNGHLLSRSPLSPLVEVEGLLLGVQGKAAGWRTLRRLADRDSRLTTERLDELIARAERQIGDLEALRQDLVDRVILQQP